MKHMKIHKTTPYPFIIFHRNRRLLRHNLFHTRLISSRNTSRMKLFVTTQIQSQSTACRKTNPNSPCPPASQPNQTLDNPVFESRRHASSISPMFHLEHRRYCAATSAISETHFTRYLFLTAFNSFSSNIGDVQNSFRPPVSCQAPKRPLPYPVFTRTIHPFPVFFTIKAFFFTNGLTIHSEQ